MPIKYIITPIKRKADGESDGLLDSSNKKSLVSQVVKMSLDNIDGHPFDELQAGTTKV